ncbi:MAG: stage II sporulation protein M [Planctomycetes bacterium]|nr:stage II sporulation protein M [Planctomycetota bacterium]
MSDFIIRHKPDWDELEALVKKARRSIRSMAVEDLSRLDVLYRRTTVHLSQAATRTTDEKLIWYLNGLTAAAHALIYLPPRQSAWAGAGRFVAEGFPRLVARCWRFHAVSAALLLGGGLLAYLVSMQDASAAYALLPPGDVRQPGSTREQLLEVLRSGRETQGGEKFLFASFLFSHNLKVGLLAMTTGVLAAVPTTLLMVYNGMMLGAFAAIHHKAGIYAEFWAWILPHGITELTAIVLCGGMGLRLGQAVIAPGLQTRIESMKQAGIETAQTCLGVAAMLVLAALLESYLRQSHLATGPRLAIAAATAVFWALVFIYGMVRERHGRADVGQLLKDAAAAVQ